MGDDGFNPATEAERKGSAGHRTKAYELKLPVGFAQCYRRQILLDELPMVPVDFAVTIIKSGGLTNWINGDEKCLRRFCGYGARSNGNPSKASEQQLTSRGQRRAQKVIRSPKHRDVEASKMNRIEKLRGNIETLKDSLALDWSDLSLPLTGEQRAEIENHLEWCLTEMDWCLAEMKKLSQRLRDTG